jgi:hypothetical protein
VLQKSCSDQLINIYNKYSVLNFRAVRKVNFSSYFWEIKFIIICILQNIGWYLAAGRVLLPAAEEALVQLTNCPSRAFVIPDLIRNPALFQDFTFLDAGSSPA